MPSPDQLQDLNNGKSRKQTLEQRRNKILGPRFLHIIQHQQPGQCFWFTSSHSLILPDLTPNRKRVQKCLPTDQKI